MICLTEQNDETANPKSEPRFVLLYIGKITKLLLYIQIISIWKLTAPQRMFNGFCLHKTNVTMYTSDKSKLFRTKKQK